MKYYSCLVILFILLVGCSTVSSHSRSGSRADIGRVLDDVVGDTKEYSLDMSKFESVESDPPNFVFLVKESDGRYRLANEFEEPALAALDENELKKIEKMLIVKNAYKSTANQQIDLINLERQKLKVLYQLNKYQEEYVKSLEEQILELNRKSFRDKLFDRAFNLLIIFGALIF